MTLPTDPHPDDDLALRHREFPTPANVPPHDEAPDTPEPDSPHAPISQRAFRRILYAFGALALLVVIALIITAAALRRDLHANLLANENLLDGRMAVAGLTAPITITRNAQNVPSIHASNLDDLLFAQGYITASDRLFQMDALRRHGAGTLAEILGPSLIPHDREQRFLQLRAAADRAAAVLPPEQLHQLQAYARGVNAYITTHNGSDGPNTLPIEFHILRYTPALWQPRDSILISLVMAQDLSTDFPAKLNREALATLLPPNLVPDLFPIGSWRDHPPTEATPDLTTPTAPVIQIPLDRTQSSVTPQSRVPHLRDGSIVAKVGWKMPDSPEANTRQSISSSATPSDLLKLSADLTNHRCDGCRAGSNNWVVAGSHTATGAPLLSNDMHLGLTAPDIWYEAALHIDEPSTTGTQSNTAEAQTTTSTPAVRAGLDVEGFTLPGVPFVIVGRNPYVAWGFTNSGADVQDVLLEHLRKTNNVVEYERPDHTWAPLTHHPEIIHVRAGKDVRLDVLTTDTALGNSTIPTPLITPLLPSERRALALAWTIYDPTTLTSSFYALDSATDAASLLAAAANFATVSQNLVYADAHHIGYHLLGRIPIRGPATPHAITTQPRLTPTTPTTTSASQADTEDESGNTQAASTETQQPNNPIASRNLNAQPTSQVPQGFSLGSHSAQENKGLQPPAIPQLPPSTLDYTIGSPLSPIPVDALNTSQAWSGYIPFNQLPAIQDPASGILATANARITPDGYPYSITLNWADPYRVERIYHLLSADIAANHPLTSADMLCIQTDTHSEFDLLVAQRLAYALDHSALAKKDKRLAQAANILRNWTGDVSTNSAAAEITSVAEQQLWPMLLAPQISTRYKFLFQKPINPQELNRILDLYNWGERRTALEQLLQNTPARWLPSTFANWNDLLATSVTRGLHYIGAPRNLSTLTYGPSHPIEIAHPFFGSHSPISTLLGVATGTGIHPNSGDSTTIKASGPHFGPSERFTADLSNPDNTHANITTGESGNPSSPHFLDQFQPWLQGTTYPLPLTHPTIQHTLTLTPQ